MEFEKYVTLAENILTPKFLTGLQEIQTFLKLKLGRSEYIRIQCALCYDVQIYFWRREEVYIRREVNLNFIKKFCNA